MSNQNKRFKKFNKELSLYAKTPLFNKVRELYIGNKIKRIDSAEKMIATIKYKKNGELFKTSEKKSKKIEDMYEEYQEELKAAIIINESKGKTTIINIKDVDDKIITDYKKYKDYKIWLHDYIINKHMTRNNIVLHTIEFYDKNKKLMDFIEVEDNGLNTSDFKFIFSEYMSRKELYIFLSFRLTIMGSDGVDVIPGFLNTNPGSSVRLITTSYKRLANEPNQKYLLQKYAENDNNNCVYVGLLDFFEKYKNSKNKVGLSIYNKLLKGADKYSKPYTDDELKKLGETFKISFNIIDLINNTSRKINEDKFNKYTVNFINSRYNHLDLLKSESKIDEVSTDEYNKIKLDTDFYVEKMGTLYTINGNYKTDTDYKNLIKCWKDLYDINSCKIDIDTDVYKFINLYDDKVHRFFNNDMIVDDNLYNELDLKKAYYNYTKCSQYIGLPSGSYISCSGEGFTSDLFMKQYKNKMVGWYEVQINTHNDKLNYLGLKKDSKHILFSSQIKLLIENNIDLIYINYCVCPSFEAPFDEDLISGECTEYLKTNFLRYIDGDILVDEEPKTQNTTKAYCKIIGEMMIDNTNYSINVKPSKDDIEFYKTLATNENLYYIDNIFKVIKDIETPRSLKHISLSIHAYSSTIILEQMLKFDNITDVMGVKVDSIVYKKDSVFNYTELFKQPIISNIEKMLNNNKPNIDDGLDFGLDIEVIINNSYNQSYFIESTNIINFDVSFCGDHITNRVLFLGGAGGTGKTHSVLTSKNFNQKRLCFTSSCWDLIQSKQSEFNDILGLSLPKITGEMNGKTVEKYNIINYNYLVNDELTLQNKKIVSDIITENERKFIILMGDIDNDGFYYQCSITPNIVVPKKIKNSQYIKYTKTYRFDDELNNKINNLRNFMRTTKEIDSIDIYNYVKENFSSCFKNINDVVINADDIGISALKNVYDKDGLCQHSKKFYENGSPKQYYIKDTKLRSGIYKGRKIEEKPDNKNYVCSLFRTIHSYQGRQLNFNNKIVILLNSMFDLNLLYTAISRARRLDQIYIIDSEGKQQGDFNQFNQKKTPEQAQPEQAHVEQAQLDQEDCEFID